MSHVGIRIRISVNDVGTLFEADSDMAHFMATYASFRSCDPLCLPGCDKHGWHKLLNGQPGGVTVEIKPVMLPDEYPDAE